MQINDLSHPATSKLLNESAAQTFGCKLNLERFTTEQLHTARANLVSQIKKFETNRSFDAVYEDRDYQKNRVFLDIVNKAISERTLSPAEEKKREVYVKGMKGKEKEFEKRYGADKGKDVMYATATKMAKAESVDEALVVLRSALTEQVLTEGEEEKAAIIMTSRDMVDKLTGWLENVASLKAESLLELLDSIRYELGSDISQQFANKVKPALEEVYTTLERNRQTLSQAVAILTGEEAPTTGAEGAPEPSATDMPIDAAPTVAGIDAELPAGDNFSATAPAAGGTDIEGRAKRESIEYSRRLGALLSSSKKN